MRPPLSNSRVVTEVLLLLLLRRRRRRRLSGALDDGGRDEVWEHGLFDALNTSAI